MVDYELVIQEISENVRALVASSGYCSVSAFCQAKRLPESSVERIAAGRCAPTLKTLVEIANGAGVSLAQILGPEAF